MWKLLLLAPGDGIRDFLGCPKWELPLLCDFEDPQQAQGSEHADAKGGSRLHRSPNHLENAAHDDLRGERTSERAQLLLSSLCCFQGGSGIRVQAVWYKIFMENGKLHPNFLHSQGENTLWFIHRVELVAFFFKQPKYLKIPLKKKLMTLPF